MIARLLPLLIEAGVVILLWELADRVKEKADKRSQYYSPALKTLAIVIAAISFALLLFNSGLLQSP